MNLRKLSLYASVLLTLFGFSGCKKESPTEPAVNHAPTIERIIANPEELFTGGISRLECITKDDDGDHLYYDWDSEGGYFSDFNNEKITWHSPREAGEYHVTVEVDDRREDGKVLGNKLLRVISRFDTLYATDDAFTFNHLPSFNTQNDTFYNKFIEIYHSGGYLEQMYLKFNLNPNKRVKSVNLRLTRHPIGDNNRLLFYLSTISEPWSENTLTANNRPDIDSVFRAELVEPLPDNGYYYFNNLTDINMRYGIMFSPGGEEVSRSFYSKEGARQIGKEREYSPALILEYE